MQPHEERRAKAAKRQAVRVAREKALGRLRRPYFATDAEHAAIAARLAELRAEQPDSAAPNDVNVELGGADSDTWL